MKLKTFLALLLFWFSNFNLNAQVVLFQDFSGYDGSVSSMPTGWFISWNSTTTPSFYSTGSYSGVNPPSYKFGVNNDTIITPAFTNADSLSFWIKSSSTFSFDNTLEIYESADSLNWSMLTALDSLPTTGKTLKFGLLATTTFLKFIYIKVSGNLAFDDISIIKNAPVMIKEFKADHNTFLYPNPCRDNVSIFPTIEYPALIKIYTEAGDLITTQLLSTSKALDLSEFKNGIYLMEIVNQKVKLLNRIIVMK